METGWPRLLLVILTVVGCWGEEDKEKGDKEWWQTIPSGMTKDLRTTIIFYHSYARNMEGAADMDKMIWDFGLESKAWKWVRRCRYQHKPVKYRDTGENLAMSTSNWGIADKITSAMKSWYNEREYFDPNNPKLNMKSLHYTQMVWSKTDRVGCAYNDCDVLTFKTGRRVKNGWFFACFYLPKGNVQNAPPFIVGSACSLCDPGESCTWRSCNGKDQRPCDNIHKNCKNLARYTNFCEEDSEHHLYMMSNCRKACGGCEPEPCKDKVRNCRKLIAEFTCAEHSHAILRACPESCKTCDF